MLLKKSAKTELIFPTAEYAEEITAYRNEMFAANSSFDGCSGLERFDTAEEWLDYLRLLKNTGTCPDGSVPSDTYLAVRKSDGRLVGITDLRHSLDTSLLKEWGGHIGYSVRPCERGKGYATEMLRMNLENCRRLGLKKVMITCYDDNIASEKVIILNGGRFEKTVKADGRTVKRYWIDLEE